MQKMWTAIISGVTNLVGGYFKDKQEIKKAKVEAEKIKIQADADIAKATAVSATKRAEAGQEQDYNLDMVAMQNMEKSWKDELILIVFMVPLVMCFIPGYDVYVMNGFTVLANTPDWYQWLLVGMIVVIYGLRGLLRYVIDKFGGFGKGK